jgi:hypothetical protein
MSEKMYIQFGITMFQFQILFKAVFLFCIKVFKIFLSEEVFWLQNETTNLIQVNSQRHKITEGDTFK